MATEETITTTTKTINDPAATTQENSSELLNQIEALKAKLAALENQPPSSAIQAKIEKIETRLEMLLEKIEAIDSKLIPADQLNNEAEPETEIDQPEAVASSVTIVEPPPPPQPATPPANAQGDTSAIAPAPVAPQSGKKKRGLLKRVLLG